MKVNSERRDYRKYSWEKGELAGAVVASAVVTVLLAYFFYGSAIAVIPLSVVGCGYFYMLRRDKTAKARENLVAQFRECILSVVTALQAGYSVENAFVESYRDMVSMYGQRAYICEELLYLKRGMEINISLEKLLLDLAERSDSEEIAQFAEIFALAKRSGGNMSEIIQAAATRIGKRIEVKQEVNMLLSGRKMELTVMKVIPFGILFYVNYGNPGYFNSLYKTPVGIAIMTACLLVYLGAVVMGNLIMERIVVELA